MNQQIVSRAEAAKAKHVDLRTRRESFDICYGPCGRHGDCHRLPELVSLPVPPPACLSLLLSVASLSIQ